MDRLQKNAIIKFTLALLNALNHASIKMRAHKKCINLKFQIIKMKLSQQDYNCSKKSFFKFALFWNFKNSFS